WIIGNAKNHNPDKEWRNTVTSSRLYMRLLLGTDLSNAKGLLSAMGEAQRFIWKYAPSFRGTL
ncbi:Hypothetical protein FKW44_009800, partial [Caligus rogercresseyi]